MKYGIYTAVLIKKMYSGSINKISKLKRIENNSMLPGKYITLITVVTFFFLSIAQAQTISPKFRLVNPVLVSGTSEQKQVSYMLSNVTTGVVAFVKIEKIRNVAKLVKIDNST